MKVYKQTIGDVTYENVQVQPLCDVFNIDFEHQRKTINKHLGLKQLVKKISDKERFGDNWKRLCLNKKGFTWWVLQLSYTLIREDLQSLFVDYQTNLFNYLYDTTYEREQLLKKRTSLENECEKLEEELDNNESYSKLINKRAEILRLGKESKQIDQKIISRQMEMKMEF